MTVPDAVFLIGGRGSRLQGVVDDRPKPMADVGGRPFLEWLLLTFRALGVRRYVFCTGYLGEMIESYFGNGHEWGVEIVYSQESIPMGTGGAVKKALDLIDSDPFLVVNGDSYCSFEIQRLENIHRMNRALATLWTVAVDECGRYGEVKVDENGCVSAFREKSNEKRPGLINAGVCLLQKEALSGVPADAGFSLETDLFPGLVGKGLSAVVGAGTFLDIGTPESYKMAWRILKEHLKMLNDAELEKKRLERLRVHFEAGNEVRSLALRQCGSAILKTVDMLAVTFRQAGKVLICGNGGSAADSQHVAAEFMSRLTREFERPALPAMALTTDTSFLTAFANDCGFEGVFSRQVQALAAPGDVLIAISTSGGSRNIIQAVQSAKDAGIYTVGLMGEGGQLASLVDVAIVIPSRNTQYVQEAMLAVEHVICDLTERALFDPEFGGVPAPAAGDWKPAKRVKQ